MEEVLQSPVPFALDALWKMKVFIIKVILSKKEKKIIIVNRKGEKGLERDASKPSSMRLERSLPHFVDMEYLSWIGEGKKYAKRKWGHAKKSSAEL